MSDKFFKKFFFCAGPWSADESWSDKARRVIQERIQLATGGSVLIPVYCLCVQTNEIANATLLLWADLREGKSAE